MKMAKRILSILMAVMMVLSCWVWTAPESHTTADAAAITGDSCYLFAYFTGTSIDGQTIHLAVSQDGLNYTALRNNEPVIVPSKGTGCVRDPYIWYNEQDEYYYILATDLDFTDTGSDYSDNSESFIIWRSKDLVNWFDETMIDVKAILGELGINNNNMQAVWAPQVLHDGTSYVVYFSLQCDATSNGSWNPLTIVYLRTTDLLVQSEYYDYGVIHNPGRHVIDADIIKKPGTNQYYMFYKDESATGGIQSIYYMISDNGPTGPYYAPNNANNGRGPQLFSEVGKNLEGCNSFFDDNGNLITYVDEYDYTNASGQKEAHFHVSSSADFSTFTTLDDGSHNINSLSPRHGSVVKITSEEYDRLQTNMFNITSSSFSETEDIEDHLVGRYFTTDNVKYNAVTKTEDLTITDGTISMNANAAGAYYAHFNNAGAQIDLNSIIPGDLNINDGFTITFTATTPASVTSNTRFFDISNNWSQRTNPAECYLHMSPVADSNGLYVGAYNGPKTTTSWTWASQGNNYNDGFAHDYVISFANGNMIMYIDGVLAMKRDRFNMNTEYGDNFLDDNWYKEIGNSKMRIGKSEWNDPLFTGDIQNLCIYDCSLSYYDAQEMQNRYNTETGDVTLSRIVVPETVYMTPSTGASTTGQLYVNNTMKDGSNDINLETTASDKGVIQFYIPGAKTFSIKVNTLTNGIGDIVLAEAGETSGSYENNAYNATATGYFSYSSIGFYIDGTGISAGNTALAEWEITVNMNDGTSKVYYAYSTLYAPYYQPVGAAAEAWSNSGWGSGTQAWLGSIAWVEGVHNATTSNYSGAGHWYPRTDNFLPMIGNFYNSGFNNRRPSGDWIQESSNGLFGSVTYYEGDGSQHRYVKVVSPLAHLTVDTSRYKNFNQIPNFKVGYMITDSENTDNGKYYFADYTGYTDNIGNGSSGKDDSGNQSSGIYNASHGPSIITADDKGCTVKYYDVWNRAIATGTVQLIGAAGANETGGTIDRSAWNFNYIQINVTGAEKTELRKLVMQATYLDKDNYTTASWNTYHEQLRLAAERLGNPASSDTDISALKNARDALVTPVSLDYNFIEEGKTESTKASMDTTVGASSTFNYNINQYPSRPGYTLKGWATSEDATIGSNPITAGLKPTFYAVWEANKYKVYFDNMFDFSKFTIGGNLTLDQRTDKGFTVTSTAGDGNTGFSYDIAVEPGKTYVLKADVQFINRVSGGYDIYVQTLDSNKAGETTAVPDTSNGANREGNVYISLTGQTTVTNPYIRFTAGDNTAYVRIRFDANAVGNTISVNNIRLYEDNGTSSEIPVEVTYDSTYGEAPLPTPTREGYKFQGWYDTSDTGYWNENTVKITSDAYVYSKWVLCSEALNDDMIVVDFDTDTDGKAITITPFDNDKILTKSGENYSIKGLSTDGETITSTIEGKYGTFNLEGSTVTYTPKSTMVDTVDSVWYHVEIPGLTDIGENSEKIFKNIRIAPASNILYEDNRFTASASSTGVAWETKTSATGSATDSTSTVYGYDSSYESNVGLYSNGSALMSTVDSTNKRSQIQTFTFQGTAFDLYGQCGANTGVMVVTVKDSNGKAIKAFVVDTYYNGTYGTLNQVPIVGAEFDDFGSYTVQVAAMYLASAGAVKGAQTQSVMGFDDMTAYSAPLTGTELLIEALCEAGMEDVLEVDDLEVIWFDDNSIFNGGYGANTYATETSTATTGSASNQLVNVIDSIRVYNPLNYNDDYYIDTEKNAQYYNVMNNLKNGMLVSGNGNFTYVNYTTESDNTEIDFTTYETKGSNEEFYLTSNTGALTFSIANVAIGGRIMVSLRAANGAPVAKIGTGQQAITSSTEMYYDITDYVNPDGTVTIQNEGTGLLAVGNVKVTGPDAVPIMMSTFNLRTARMMMAAPAEDVEFNAPEEEPEIIVPDEPETEEPSTEIPEVPSDDADEEEKSFIDKIYDLIDFIVNLVKKLFSTLDFMKTL